MKVSPVDLRAKYLTVKDEIDAAISSVIADSACIGGARVTTNDDRLAEGCGHVRNEAAEQAVESGGVASS